MKQNTFWLIVGLFVVIFIQGFFVLLAENKIPGIIIMLTSLIGLLLSIFGSNK